MKKYSKFLSEFTKREFEEFLMSEDHIDEVFEVFADFVEDCLVHQQKLLLA